MDGEDKRLFQNAIAINQLLDESLGFETDSNEAATWVDILRRNGVEQQTSKFHLTTCDQVVVCTIGIVGGVLDLSRSFSKAMTNEDLHQRFDRLSKNYTKEVTGCDGIAAIDNIKGGPAHRLVGPSHDLTRLFETIGQMLRGEFSSNVSCVRHVANQYTQGGREYLKIESPVDAAIILLLHLIGDFFSKTSLPIPGRTILAESDRVELVREIFAEYRNDGNLRTQVSKLLSTLSGALVISVFLWLYRCADLVVRDQRKLVASLIRVREDIKFHVLMRNAQSIAFAISLGKASFTANLADVNYLSFVQIVRSGASINRLSCAEQDTLMAKLKAIRGQIESL